MTAPCHVHPRIADYRGAYRHVPFCARPFADDLVRTLALLGAKSGTTAAARRPDNAGFGARDIPALQAVAAFWPPGCRTWPHASPARPKVPARGRKRRNEAEND